MTPRVRRAILTAVIIASSAFAFWSPNVTTVATPQITPSERSKKPIGVLNMAAFRIPIWVADPVPPPPPSIAAVPATPPPPIRLQLLAIIREDNFYSAAVYDPDSDRILIVESGQKIGSRSVESVDRSTLTLRDGANTHTLVLKKSGEGS